MKTILLILILSTNVFSKSVESTLENKYIELCFNTFSANPLIKPYLADDFFNKMKVENELNLISYCSCLNKELKSERSLARTDWIAYQFRDKEKEWLKKDFCAVENISTNLYPAFYQSRLVTYFNPWLISKIDHIVQAPAIRKISSEDRFYNYQQCLLEETSKNCTKNMSLASTYLCLKNNLKMDKFDNYNKSCIYNLSKNGRPELVLPEYTGKEDII